MGFYVLLEYSDCSARVITLSKDEQKCKDKALERLKTYLEDEIIDNEEYKELKKSNDDNYVIEKDSYIELNIVYVEEI